MRMMRSRDEVACFPAAGEMRGSFAWAEAVAVWLGVFGARATSSGERMSGKTDVRK